jgi:hypothetical protein
MRGMPLRRSVESRSADLEASSRREGRTSGAARRAQIAWDEGDQFFECTLALADRTPRSRPPNAHVLAEVESHGWRLEHAGYLMRADDEPVGVYLFRRPAPPAPHPSTTSQLRRAPLLTSHPPTEPDLAPLVEPQPDLAAIVEPASPAPVFERRRTFAPQLGGELDQPDTPVAQPTESADPAAGRSDATEADEATTPDASPMDAVGATYPVIPTSDPEIQPTPSPSHPPTDSTTYTGIRVLPAGIGWPVDEPRPPHDEPPTDTEPDIFRKDD